MLAKPVVMAGWSLMAASIVPVGPPFGLTRTSRLVVGKVCDLPHDISFGAESFIERSRQGVPARTVDQYETVLQPRRGGEQPVHVGFSPWTATERPWP
jgi:hypothetical protein